MFQATITRFARNNVTLGPTDSRDEAARLARTWMESQPETARGDVTKVEIKRVKEEE